MVAKPKMKSLGKGSRGITEKEFNLWFDTIFKNSVKAFSFNKDPKNAFYATEGRITRSDNMVHEAILIIPKTSKG